MPETGDIIAMALNAAEGSALERGEIPSYGMWADFVLESLKRAGSLAALGMVGKP